jgi:hypothetical protein
MNSFLSLCFTLLACFPVFGDAAQKRFIFRLDDIEDFFNSDIQADMLNLFMDRGVGVSAGIIGDYFTGADPVLMTVLHRCISVGKNKCAIFNHGADAVFTFKSSLSVAEAKTKIKSCDDKIKNVFPGYVPELFVPHQNSWNSYVLTALKELGYLAVSASNEEYSNMAYDLTKDPIQIPQQTTTAEYENGGWVGIPISTTLSACNSAALRGEACIIMTHPHEFFEGTYSLATLSSLIDALLADGFVSANFHTLISEVKGDSPTAAPITRSPSAAPVTRVPTISPTTKTPTASPSTTVPSASPTVVPTIPATAAPITRSPSAAPVTSVPTISPTTKTPTASPSTTVPSASPTVVPTIPLTTTPSTTSPSVQVTVSPSLAPSSVQLVVPGADVDGNSANSNQEALSYLTRPAAYMIAVMAVVGVLLIALICFSVYAFRNRQQGNGDSSAKSENSDSVETSQDELVDAAETGLNKSSEEIDGEKYVPENIRRSASRVNINEESHTSRLSKSVTLDFGSTSTEGEKTKVDNSDYSIV